MAQLVSNTKTEQKKIKTKSLSVFFPLIKHRNKDYNNDSYFHKIYSGEELEHDFFIPNHKIVYHFNYETE